MGLESVSTERAGGSHAETDPHPPKKLFGGSAVLRSVLATQRPHFDVSAHLHSPTLETPPRHFRNTQQNF